MELPYSIFLHPSVCRLRDRRMMEGCKGIEGREEDRSSLDFGSELSFVSPFFFFFRHQPSSCSFAFLESTWFTQAVPGGVPHPLRTSLFHSSTHITDRRRTRAETSPVCTAEVSFFYSTTLCTLLPTPYSYCLLSTPYYLFSKTYTILLTPYYLQPTPYTVLYTP